MFSPSMWKSSNLLLSYFAVFRCSSLVSSQKLSMAAAQAGDFSVSYVTTPSQEVAEKIASDLVEKRLAACVNIVPGITSIYRWKGAIEKDKEVMMVIKSPTISLPELTSAVKKLHPYEVCEVISMPIKSGNPDYLQFLHDATIAKKH